MTTKTRKKVTRSFLAMAIVFALFGSILFAPMTYAETNKVTWDSTILSTFEETDTTQ